MKRKRNWTRAPLLASALAALVAASMPMPAHAGWPDVREGTRLARDDDRSRGPFGADGIGTEYAPSRCRWIQVSKTELGPDPNGRMVYRVTQQNSCTGKQRTFRTY